MTSKHGLALELASEADELEAVLGREQRPGDPVGVQARGQQEDRKQTAAMGHRDPP